MRLQTRLISSAGKGEFLRSGGWCRYGAFSSLRNSQIVRGVHIWGAQENEHRSEKERTETRHKTKSGKKQEPRALLPCYSSSCVDFCNNEDQTQYTLYIRQVLTSNYVISLRYFCALSWVTIQSHEQNISCLIMLCLCIF